MKLLVFDDFDCYFMGEIVQFSQHPQGVSHILQSEFNWIHQRTVSFKKIMQLHIEQAWNPSFLGGFFLLHLYFISCWFVGFHRFHHVQTLAKSSSASSSTSDLASQSMIFPNIFFLGKKEPRKCPQEFLWSESSLICCFWGGFNG